MNETSQPTTLVKKSNIGFLLGILVVVALGMYVFRSGLFTKKVVMSPGPTPMATALPEISEEPITLLEDESIKLEKIEVTETHEPVDTALGDNPLYLLALLFGSAGVTFMISKKLEVRS